MLHIIKESNSRQASSLCLWTTRMDALVSPQIEVSIWRQSYRNSGECTVINQGPSSCAPQDCPIDVYEEKSLSKQDMLLYSLISLLFQDNTTE